jgi:hypothetical protein
MDVPSPTNSKKQKHVSWSSNSVSETETPKAKRTGRKKKARNQHDDEQMDSLAGAVAGMNIIDAQWIQPAAADQWQGWRAPADRWNQWRQWHQCQWCQDWHYCRPW